MSRFDIFKIRIFSPSLLSCHSNCPIMIPHRPHSRSSVALPVAFKRSPVAVFHVPFSIDGRQFLRIILVHSHCLLMITFRKLSHLDACSPHLPEQRHISNLSKHTYDHQANIFRRRSTRVLSRVGHKSCSSVTRNMCDVRGI